MRLCVKGRPCNGHKHNAALTFASAAVYCAGGGVDWHTLLFAAPGAILGSIAGAKLTGRIKSAALDKLFAAVMFCAGVWMLL